MLGKQNLQSKPSRLGHHEQQSRADAEPTQQRSLQLAKCHWRMAAMFTTGLLACIDRPMRRQATGKVRPSAYAMTPHAAAVQLPQGQLQQLVPTHGSCEQPKTRNAFAMAAAGCNQLEGLGSVMVVVFL